ncbi:MAG: hypothetical protein ACR2MK_05595 [Solirubrobacteraceae bacterium]
MASSSLIVGQGFELRSLQETCAPMLNHVVSPIEPSEAWSAFPDSSLAIIS